MEDDLIEDIAVELESTSFWRDQKAAEFPDEERNEGASQLLQRLAHEVRAMAGSDLAVELQKANEKLRDVSADFNELITEEGQYRSRIGFDHFPSNGSEYLEHLLDLCREYIATSERRSSDANEPSVRPPPPSRQPPPGWTAGVDDATNQIIQQTHAHQRRAHIAATANAPGVIGPPPAPPEPPLDATSGAEPPKIVQLEGRATMMMSGAASMRTDATVPASITPTGVGSEGASPRPGTDEPPIDSIPQQVTAASQFTLDAAGRID